MKIIKDVIPFVSDDGSRAIEIVYDKGRKIVPFDETTLIKYRRIYMKQHSVTNVVKTKTNTNVDIDVDNFADYIINNKELILRRIKIALIIGALVYGIKSCHNEFSDLPDVVLPDEEKEEVITYDVSEYYYNLNNEETMTK